MTFLLELSLNSNVPDNVRLKSQQIQDYYRPGNCLEVLKTKHVSIMFSVFLMFYPDIFVLFWKHREKCLMNCDFCPKLISHELSKLYVHILVVIFFLQFLLLPYSEALLTGNGLCWKCKKRQNLMYNKPD